MIGGTNEIQLFSKERGQRLDILHPIKINQGAQYKLQKQPANVRLLYDCLFRLHSAITHKLPKITKDC